MGGAEFSGDVADCSGKVAEFSGEVADFSGEVAEFGDGDTTRACDRRRRVVSDLIERERARVDVERERREGFWDFD